MILSDLVTLTSLCCWFIPVVAAAGVGLMIGWFLGMRERKSK